MPPSEAYARHCMSKMNFMAKIHMQLSQQSRRGEEPQLFLPPCFSPAVWSYPFPAPAQALTQHRAQRQASSHPCCYRSHLSGMWEGCCIRACDNTAYHKKPFLSQGAHVLKHSAALPQTAARLHHVLVQRPSKARIATSSRRTQPHISSW